MGCAAAVVLVVVRSHLLKKKINTTSSFFTVSRFSEIEADEYGSFLKIEEHERLTRHS